MSDEQVFVMPDWMEPYRPLFQNTGGNEIEWLLGPQAAKNCRTNVILAALVVSVEAQVTLLYRMHDRGMLASVEPTAVLSSERTDTP